MIGVGKGYKKVVTSAWFSYILSFKRVKPNVFTFWAKTSCFFQDLNKKLFRT